MQNDNEGKRTDFSLTIAIEGLNRLGKVISCTRSTSENGINMIGTAHLLIHHKNLKSFLCLQYDGGDKGSDFWQRIDFLQTTLPFSHLLLSRILDVLKTYSEIEAWVISDSTN